MGNPNLKTTRKRRRGFSLIEVMIATAVLGIAMAGLVKLHRASIRGMKTTTDMTIAEDIAEQVADEIAAQNSSTLPSNIAAPGVASPCNQPGTCKANGGGFTRNFAVNKPSPCTTWFTPTGTGRRGDGPGVGRMDAQVLYETEAAAIAAGANYRVDRVIVPHPGAGARSTVIDVFVCWRDEGQIVREVHTRRLVGP